MRTGLVLPLNEGWIGVKNKRRVSIELPLFLQMYFIAARTKVNPQGRVEGGDALTGTLRKFCNTPFNTSGSRSSICFSNLCCYIISRGKAEKRKTRGKKKVRVGGGSIRYRGHTQDRKKLGGRIIHRISHSFFPLSFISPKNGLAKNMSYSQLTRSLPIKSNSPSSHVALSAEKSCFE